nr:PREDICTED: olfactory receptor 52L1 [Bos mutus]
MAVVKLACGATTVDNLYAFAVEIFLGAGDVAFIAYSYGQIVDSDVIHKNMAKMWSRFRKNRNHDFGFFASSLSKPLMTTLSNSSWRLIEPSFFLIGIPGLEESQHWIALLLCVLYLLALLGNVTVLFTIWTDPSLHQPMYLFLAMLSGTDLVLASSTAPKTLAVLLVHAHEIGYTVCLIQMFFIHAFSSMESGVLVAMALDRYVAICHPLHHSTILHPRVIGRIGMAVLVRGILLLLPFPILLRRLVFCQATIIGHAYCEHMAVVKLSCSDSTVNRAYGLAVALLVVGLDVLAIGVSYALILQAVLKVPGGEARLKAFSTCGSHICVILVFYVPGIFSFLTHRFGRQVPHHVHVLLATLYLLVPPALNPLVYGVKTQQIRQRVLRVFDIKGQI